MSQNNNAGRGTRVLHFPNQARQGDVFIVRVADKLDAKTRKKLNVGEEIPAEAGRAILAHGEVTGHSHAIDARHVRQFAISAPQANGAPARPDREDDAVTRLRGGSVHVQSILEVKEPCKLLHEEHDPIAFEPGVYKIVRQREYLQKRVRTVAD